MTASAEPGAIAAPLDLDAHRRDIDAAALRIRGHVRRTPALATDLDPSLVLKPECFQPTGSFKVRGAFNAVLRIAGRPDPPGGVIAVSSGNHAQAVALAARKAGIPALILIPEDANPVKVAATRALGAEVITEGITFNNREQRVREEAQARGYELVHPFDNWDIIHGAGTAALELVADAEGLDVIATPVGGGGLLSGTALAVKSRHPDVRVVGVEPASADDAQRSFRDRRIVSLTAAPKTIADGVRTVSIGKRNFATMVTAGLVDEIVTVEEDEIAAGTVVAWTKAKLALEPTGALPLAAFLAGKLRGRRIGMILSGGNASPALIARLLDPQRDAI